MSRDKLWAITFLKISWPSREVLKVSVWIHWIPRRHTPQGFSCSKETAVHAALEAGAHLFELFLNWAPRKWLMIPKYIGMLFVIYLEILGDFTFWLVYFRWVETYVCFLVSKIQTCYFSRNLGTLCSIGDVLFSTRLKPPTRFCRWPASYNYIDDKYRTQTTPLSDFQLTSSCQVRQPLQT